jgi:hypothetical protein
MIASAGVRGEGHGLNINGPGKWKKGAYHEKKY